MFKKSMIVFPLIVIAYSVSNVTFVSGLDDTVIQIAAERFISENSSGFLSTIPSTLLTPPPADSVGLFRPLRTLYSELLVLGALKIRWLPDLISAFAAGCCALVLLRYHILNKLPPRAALFSSLWFFGCIPVVAMGQVVLCSQFVVIGGLYSVLILFQSYLDSRRSMWFVLASLSVFVFGLYGEALLIAPVAIGVRGLLFLVRRDFDAAVRAFSFAVLGSFLVIGNAVLMTGDPNQFTRGLMSVLATRGYDMSHMVRGDYFHLLANRISGYLYSFRSQMFSGIFFSASPLLFMSGMAAFAGMSVIRRRFVALGTLSAAAIIAPWDVAWGIGVASASLCIGYAPSYPLLVGMFVGGVFVLGPIFVIDTHITYLLPTLLGLLFVALSEAGAWLQSHGQRALVWGSVAVLAIVGGANFGSGVYLSARVANDNRQFARHLGEVIRSGSVLVNFRHAIDLYFYANEERKFCEYEGLLHFTATAPLWGDDRIVQDEKKLHDWFQSATAAGKPKYFLVIDHDRLPQKVQFHSPRFLTCHDYYYRLLDVHVFHVLVPFLDPGFLFVDYFYKHRLSVGFIGYPVFPDMIDDIGVEYGLFTKRLFACYRLFEVERRGEGGASTVLTGCASNERVVISDYYGYKIVAEDQHFSAHALASGVEHSPEPITSERLDIVMQTIRQSRKLHVKLP